MESTHRTGSVAPPLSQQGMASDVDDSDDDLRPAGFRTLSTVGCYRLAALLLFLSAVLYVLALLRTVLFEYPTYACNMWRFGVPEDLDLPATKGFYRDFFPRPDTQEESRRHPRLLRPTRHQQRAHRSHQRTTRAPARLRTRIPQPHQLHRQIPARDRRIQTATTPSIVKRRETNENETSSSRGRAKTRRVDGSGRTPVHQCFIARFR